MVIGSMRSDYKFAVFRFDREGTSVPSKSGDAAPPAEPDLMATQKLDGPPVPPPELPFANDEFVETVTNAGGDKRSIEELEDSLNEKVRRDQLNS